MVVTTRSYAFWPWIGSPGITSCALIGFCGTHNLLSENAKITASNLLHWKNNTLLKRDAPIVNSLLITLQNIMQYLFFHLHFITNTVTKEPLIDKRNDMSILVRGHHCWQHLWTKIREMCATKKMDLYNIYKTWTVHASFIIFHQHRNLIWF